MKRYLLIISILGVSLVSLFCYRNDVFVHNAALSLINPNAISPDATPGSTPQNIYIFAGPQHDGNMMVDGATVYPDPRTGTDAMCLTAQTNNYPALNGLTVQALISTSTAAEINGLIPSSLAGEPVYGVSASGIATLIANAWGDLLTGAGIMANLTTATGSTTLPDKWWSGSDSAGMYDTIDNCNGWGDNTAPSFGANGSKTNVDLTWIKNGKMPCNQSLTLMCMAH